MNLISSGKEIIDIEIESLKKLKDSLNENFEKIINLIKECKGKVIITGVGKSGHIARKIAATLSSLGTSSFFLNPMDALHGDLGMVSNQDIVIAISKSGESEEILRLLPNINLIGAKIIAFTSNPESQLAKYSTVRYIFPEIEEACYLNLAPTSSTTMTLVFGDAIAVVLSKIYGFNKNNFALFHPAGTLGKKLITKVSSLMHSGDDNATIYINETLKNAIIELNQKALGIINIIDQDSNLIGILTDGDIRRLLEGNIDIYSTFLNDVINTNPLTIYEDELAIVALKSMNSKKKTMNALPVLNRDNKLIGTILIHDIIREGILL